GAESAAAAAARELTQVRRLLARAGWLDPHRRSCSRSNARGECDRRWAGSARRRSHERATRGRIAQHARTAGRSVRRESPLRRPQQSSRTAHRHGLTVGAGNGAACSVAAEIGGVAGRRRMTISTIIVDDEALSRRGIEIRLLTTPDFQVVAQCSNGREALAAVTQHKPDVLFLDIQMPGMSGFDVLAHLPQESLPVVVFITAYDQYAIRAFEAHAVDYLLKPVDDGRFIAALERIRVQVQSRAAASQRDRLVQIIAEMSGSGERALEELLARGPPAAEPRRPGILPIRQGRETVRVAIDSIQWI